MAVRVLSAPHNCGAELHLIRIAINHYKHENNILKRNAVKLLAKFKIKKMVILNDYYNKFPYSKINNVYTIYPILLDKKYKIYSNSINNWDLNNQYYFDPNGLILINKLKIS